MEFIESKEMYPVALLGDITIHFNHSETREDAEEKWNSRKSRINYNNIYIIMYYREGYTVDEIREIEKARCKNLIVLTSEELDLEYAYYIQQNYEKVNGDSFLDKDDFGIRTFEKQWDFVSWLNREKQFNK